MFHPNEPAFEPCATGPQPGTANLQMTIMERFPLAKDFGIFNCRPVRGGTTLSKHGKGRAGDSGFQMVNGAGNPQGYALVAVLIENAWELGLETIIWDGQLWSARHPLGRPYVPPPRRQLSSGSCTLGTDHQLRQEPDTRSGRDNHRRKRVNP